MTIVKRFDPGNFLRFAFLLFKTQPILVDEATIRTIMNRCYYAVYLALREKLHLPINTTHRDLYCRVKKLDVRLAKKLDFLWAFRRAADYFMASPAKVRGFKIVQLIVLFKSEEAERCLDLAQDSLDELRGRLCKLMP